MQREQLLKAVQKDHFKPFRLHTMDGRSYLVRHPELCLVGASRVIVFLNKQGETEPDFEDFAYFDLTEVADCQTVERNTTPGRKAS